MEMLLAVMGIKEDTVCIAVSVCQDGGCDEDPNFDSPGLADSTL